MYKHPHFDLTIHGEILARERLHEWPLSYVERVTTPQG